MGDSMPLLFHYLALGALLFGLGVAGLSVRRHWLSAILSAGIMFQGVILTLIAFAAYHRTWSGQVMVLLAMVVTTVQGIVALALWWGTTWQEEVAEKKQSEEPEGVDGIPVHDPVRIGTPEILVETADE